MVRGSYAFFSVAFHWDGIPEKSCRQSIESWNRRVWMEFFARCGFSAAGGLVARPSEPPPRVGVVKPDKRRRATLGGGDMPKAIHAHLLLFPRTREHLKPTLTPPSQIEPLPRGCCTDTPTWLCVGNQRHLVRTTMIVNSTFEQYWQQSGVVAALTVQSIASRLALMAAPKVE